jgi:hypothetical protein
VRTVGHRRGVAALATLLLTVGLAVASPTAETRASPEPMDAHAVAGTIQVVAAPAASGVLRDDTDLVVRVTVTNATAIPLENATARLHFVPEPLVDQAAVRAWLSDAAPPSGPVAAIVPLVDIAADSIAVATLTVPADTIDLDETFGVRAVGVSIVGSTGTALAHDRTAVVGQPAGTTAAGTGIVVIAPLTAPDDRGRYLNADQLAALTAPGGRLSRTLDTAIGRGVTLGVDPRILASIRVLGDAAPARASEWLQQLADSGAETFALHWSDADPLAAIGLLDTATPPVFGAGSAVLAGDGAASATLEQLTQWPHPLANWVWPADGALGADALDVLGSDGVRVVITHGSEVRGGAALTRPLTSEVRAVAADDLATDAVRAVANSTSAQVRRAAVAKASALLASAPSSSLPLVGLADRAAEPSAQLAQFLDELTALPWGRSASLAPVTGVGVNGQPAELAADVSAPDSMALDALLELERGDAAYARIAIDPEPLLADRRLDLLDALAIGGEPAAAAAERYREQSQSLRSAVQVVESNTITLFADRTSLPVTVQNSLPVAVRVFVRVEATTGQLRVEDQRVETVVNAGSQARALVPVQSLVNGDVDIRVSLRADDGAVIATPIAVRLNLQAGWETAGTIAIGGIIAALFAVGLVRDIRRRRLARGDADPTAPDPETSHR